MLQLYATGADGSTWRRERRAIRCLTRRTDSMHGVRSGTATLRVLSFDLLCTVCREGRPDVREKG